MVIAQDAQGAGVARPWVEKAEATYRALLDQHNVIGKAYSLKFVPVGILVDEEGRLARAVGGVNIDDEAFRRELTGWVTTGTIPRAWVEADRRSTPRALTPDEAEADARFQLAVVLLEQGKREEAIAELKRAFRLDPENWLIRKQLWAVEHPEAFYSGPVDFDWQKRQRQEEDAEMRQK
ncbi:MAG: hypothetical protein A3F84_15350 [Candidatus Handelsmanbacteria bacterium RIFCSPLOWO2_12_FULL_64_10]|uniref:Uncharacterized protein n=1 Tax=Handelsmanbacteria sp. (strain RIFCSPLOWO2_12_FULL_64_10) TaxID=1817868 RepID=A0A1F6CBS5_HANXR|nr:MAG: hypothetical protein A3F84_15350 [Candidatus Handelsmanbacteria bacterium RIFCSPLOWO2_12_FULL_64_10]